MRRPWAIALVAALALVMAVAAIRGSGAFAPAAAPVQTRLDLRLDEGRAARFLRFFSLSTLHPSLGVDEIRAIDHPLLDRPAAVRGLLHGPDLVIGISLHGDARAYPVDVLSLHEVANDVVGGVPVAITWCPLCRSATAFERRVDGAPLVFGVSGYLEHANQVLFDRQTRSLWSQILGGAVTGHFRGTQLRPVPVTLETWSSWRAAHPATRVLSIRRDALATRFTRPFELKTDRGSEGSNEPYASYYAKTSLYFSRVVRGVTDAEHVLGVVVRGHPKAYPVLRLARRRAVDDVLAGTPLLLVHDEAAAYDAAFLRRVRGRTLSFQLRGSRLVDRETGSTWSPLTGRAVDGPLAGASLARVPAWTSFWFAWREFYPDSLLYREELESR